VNESIQCAGVLVNPGDLVLGDEIGVVVIPFDKAAEILEKARTQADNEEKTRARIREGKTVDQILAEFGRM
jgi:regulator of RNase E activity RraA